MPERSLADNQAFFATRAATWDQKFHDDGPAYDRAAADLAPPSGGVVLDLGCGTGRALEWLRRVVGPAGVVIGLDGTWEMLEVAQQARRHRDGALVASDAVRLPLRDRSVDAVFAAGILHHLPEPDHGLVELARVTRPGGRLAIFHPIGRAALAARHGKSLSDDDLLAAPNLEQWLARYGWTVASIDDGIDRYLAIGTCSPRGG
jgi:SAM-dependent methyltransferase